MNSNPLTGLDEALHALAAAGGSRPVESLTPGELVAVNAAVGVLRRRVDAVGSRVAAEISRQSRVELGKDSLARRQGFRSPEAMISATTGIPVFEAKRMVQVGEATTPRVSVSGEPVPEKHPHVAAAVRSGVIGTTAAAAILTLLNRVAVRAEKTLLGEMEAHLATAAVGLRPDELAKLLTRAEALLDPAGAERKQAEIYADRSLTISERDGVLRVEYRSDVVSGAPVKAAIEGIVTAILQGREGNTACAGDCSGGDGPTGDAYAGDGCGNGDHACPGDNNHGHSTGNEARTARDCRGDRGSCGNHRSCGNQDSCGTGGVCTQHCGSGHRDDAEADQRSIRQLRADALTELCRHALGCEQTPTRPTATVVVRMNLEDLQTGVEQATIDGIDQPLTAGQVRRMAADLELIPLVLGSQSEILDLGRSARLFTPKQKLAITGRDGGCVSCGAPASRCHVHHLQWWCHGGRTDLSNGVLLCSACHHRIHDDGWDIRIDGPSIHAKVWLIPPKWIDPKRTPRLAGRHRYDLVTTA